MKVTEVVATPKEFKDALKDPNKLKFSSKLPIIKDKIVELGLIMNAVTYVRAADKTIGIKFTIGALSTDLHPLAKVDEAATTITDTFPYPEFNTDVYSIGSGNRIRAYEVWLR